MTYGTKAMCMITRGIRAFMSRDWRRARNAKDDWWAERVRRLGPAEAFRIADELRRQVLAQHPDWPDAASRADDLRHHVHMAELFTRADAARRPASDTTPGAGSSPGALVAGGTKAEPSAPDQPPAERDSERDPDSDGATQEAGGTDWFAEFYGGLRGTVKITPGTDLTAPVADGWDADRDR